MDRSQNYEIISTIVYQQISFAKNLLILTTWPLYDSLWFNDISYLDSWKLPSYRWVKIGKIVQIRVFAQLHLPKRLKLTSMDFFFINPLTTPFKKIHKNGEFSLWGKYPKLHFFLYLATYYSPTSFLNIFASRESSIWHTFYTSN